jgi:tetratricopeptide (TPR) repeat protein
MAEVRGNPQIYHYLRKYQEDPRSRVFAPLAEAYRRAGLLNEAIEIARDGVRIHPHFVGGKVALARALFDKGEYSQVIKELEMAVVDSPDNLVAQKLLAESYLIQGRIADSLASYKVLLFFMPQDQEVARLVEEIESRAYEDGALVMQKDPIPLRSYSVKDASQAISGDPTVRKKEWIKKIEVLQTLLVRVQRFKLAKHA